MTANERRTKLSEMLHLVLGSENVYFQPPENQKIEYPAIIYNLEKENVRRANNRRYFTCDRYQIKFIRKQFESDVTDKLLDLPYCEHTREYKYADLYHDVYSIYI